MVNWFTFLRPITRQSEQPTHPMRNDFEKLLQEFYEALLHAGDVCVDVGAHVGRHAGPMSRRVGAGGEVHAFEPIPHCLEVLRQLAHDSAAKMVVYPVALSDYTGLSDFVLTANLPEYSGLKERMYDRPVDKQHLTVEVHKLDEYGVHLPRLAFVKIDAEGGECGILRGARATLEKFRPVVSFEFGMNSSANYGIEPVDVYDFLTGLGYRILDIRGRSLAREAFDQSARVQHVWDYIAAPPGQFDWAAATLARHVGHE